jgi:predicted oxidoreductase
MNLHTPFTPPHPGLAIGCMRLGSWGAAMNTADLRTFVDGCLELGLTLFDHADLYGHYSTEADFGRMLREDPALRGRLMLMTKCGIRMPAANRPSYRIKSYDCSRDHILFSVEQSLRHFHTEYLDVLLLHRPDLLLAPQEVAEAFSTLRQQGKVRAFGVSNFSPSQLQLLRSVFPDLAFHQVEISALQPAAFLDGTLDQCLEHGLRPMAWSPLAGGKLMEDPRLHSLWPELTERYSACSESLAYAWLLAHPARILPVTGTTRLERIREAASALKIRLTREDWYRIWSAVQGDVA